MSNKLSEIVSEIEKDLREKVVRRLENDYRKLRNRILLSLAFTSTLILVLGLIGDPVITNILSLDVLEADIETLKEDVEDLEDEIRN